jgi:hypothetical protein
MYFDATVMDPVDLERVKVKDPFCFHRQKTNDFI